MTNTELIELLREARRWVGHNLDCTAVCDECVVAARIDAALASHEAEERVDSATPVVEWVDGAFRGYTVAVGPLTLSTFPIDGKWMASVAYTMPFDTLDEAKSAAIAAARGMR